MRLAHNHLYRFWPSSTLHHDFIKGRRIADFTNVFSPMSVEDGEPMKHRAFKEAATACIVK